jgi:hypothetical protein
LRIRCASIEEAAKLRHAVDDLKDEHTGCAEMVEMLRECGKNAEEDGYVYWSDLRTRIRTVLAKHEGKAKP